MMLTEEQMKEMRESQADIFQMVTHKAHNHVKNIVYNELGITREWIEQIIRQEVEVQIKQRLDNQHNWMAKRLELLVWQGMKRDVLAEIGKYIASRLDVTVKT